MYCTKCGIQIPNGSSFCSRCGQALDPNAPLAQDPNAPQPPAPPRLSRPVYDKKIAGVCAGFARYLGTDVTLVRILWLVLIFIPFPMGIIAYIVAWILMPRDPLQLPAPVAPISSAVPKVY